MPDEPSAASSRASSATSPAVRRAADGPGPRRARPSLAHALDDVDEGCRAAAFAGMRMIHGVDEAVVARVDQLLNGGAPASDELRAGAAGSLAEVTESARGAAIEVLARTLRPKPRSVLSLFKTPDDGEGVLVLATVARVLLVLGGAQGRKEVEQRAASSRGELKKALPCSRKPKASRSAILRAAATPGRAVGHSWQAVGCVDPRGIRTENRKPASACEPSARVSAAQVAPGVAWPLPRVDALHEIVQFALREGARAPPATATTRAAEERPAPARRTRRTSPWSSSGHVRSSAPSRAVACPARVGGERAARGTRAPPMCPSSASPRPPRST
jgi:hypothetical protein